MLYVLTLLTYEEIFHVLDTGFKAMKMAIACLFVCFEIRSHRVSLAGLELAV